MSPCVGFDVLVDQIDGLSGDICHCPPPRPYAFPKGRIPVVSQNSLQSSRFAAIPLNIATKRRRVRGVRRRSLASQALGPRTDIMELALRRPGDAQQSPLIDRRPEMLFLRHWCCLPSPMNDKSAALRVISAVCPQTYIAPVPLAGHRKRKPVVKPLRAAAGTRGCCLAGSGRAVLLASHPFSFLLFHLPRRAGGQVAVELGQQLRLILAGERCRRGSGRSLPRKTASNWPPPRRD